VHLLQRSLEAENLHASGEAPSSTSSFSNRLYAFKNDEDSSSSSEKDRETASTIDKNTFPYQ